MAAFLQKCGEDVTESLSGFDRLVFRRTLRRLPQDCPGLHLPQ
jgi:hypothetical protein